MLRSTSRTSTGARLRARAQVSPPKPAPAMTTRGRSAFGRIALSLLRRVATATAITPVGHLLHRPRAAHRLEQRQRQLLLLLDYRLEEVAVLLDTLQHLVGVEDEEAWVLRLQALLDLLPGHRRGDGRTRPRTQRIDVDSGLVLVVLAPVDQHATGAQLLQLLVHGEGGVLLLEVLSEPLGDDLGLVVVDLRVERHVELQPLGAGRLRAAVKPVLREDITEHQPDPTALDDGRGRARVEIEDQGSRFGQLAAQRQR